MEVVEDHGPEIPKRSLDCNITIFNSNVFRLVQLVMVGTILREIEFFYKTAEKKLIYPTRMHTSVPAPPGIFYLC